MTDKVKKIREEVEKLKLQLLRGACSSQIAMETHCKEEAYNEVLAILDTMQKEPVSEDLHAVAKEYAGNITDKIGYNLQLRRAVVYGAKWKEEQIIANAVDGRLHSKVCGSEQNVVAYAGYGEYGKDGDKVKVIIIKSE